MSSSRTPFALIAVSFFTIIFSGCQPSSTDEASAGIEDVSAFSEAESTSYLPPSVIPESVGEFSDLSPTISEQAVNPYVKYLSDAAAALPAPVKIPETGKQSDVVAAARDLEHRVWAALDARSTVDASVRERLLHESLGMIDAITARMEIPGTEGDPNMGRFLLAPLLKAIYDIREAQAAPALQIDTWLLALRPAIDFQYVEYGGNTDENWDTRLAGGYPNMDAAYVFVMGLAARLYQEPVFAESAETFVGYLQENILPGGSIRYTGSNRGEGLNVNAAPVYTGVVIRFVGQYLDLTGSAAARELLMSMEPHFPRAWEMPGIPENTTAPWWKHTNYTNRLAYPGTFEIIASVANSSENKYYADELVSNGRLQVGDALSAVNFYDASLVPQAPADNTISLDPDINGFRGRFGHFSWVGALGPIQDSLVGAMAVVPKYGARKIKEGSAPAYDFYSLLLVTPEVGLDGRSQPKSPLFQNALFATGEDYAGSSMVAKDASMAVLGATYSLRQPGIYQPENPDSDWEVDQVWLFLDNYLIGRCVMRYTGEERDLAYARMRIRTEHRNKLRPIGDGAYRIGPLRLRVLESSFPKLRHGLAEITDHRRDQPNADEVFLEESGGRPFSHSALIDLSYQNASVASSFTELDGGGLMGFSIEIDGHRYAVWFNQSDKSVKLPVSIKKAREIRIYTASGKGVLAKEASFTETPLLPPFGVACAIR
ncbi:hypothetical protein QEH59_06755 [Coraliomargarita sp. SDUM461004]|uniref:DUF3131 domain-containing protein n=1 Tax=Thalassobacterium sedimentorum TaxID=3041258 RepID=A0ABU1AH66_9BACT|nr:hypothetical protein [Coraliomargarita sp. SDUM461004]MDQ8194116.1 hypothetical protein [Coraliomargarita sp. SDUM461004]